jgi:hypothetical protein
MFEMLVKDIVDVSFANRNHPITIMDANWIKIILKFLSPRFLIATCTHDHMIYLFGGNMEFLKMISMLSIHFQICNCTRPVKSPNHDQDLDFYMIKGI